MTTPTSGGRDPAPVFVIASPRSGTSVLSWALGQHPNLAVLQETVWIAGVGFGVRVGVDASLAAAQTHLREDGIEPASVGVAVGRAVNDVILDGFDAAVADADRQLVDGPREGEIRRRHDLGDPKARFVDATPYNTHFGPALLELFPTARFIHLLRSPTDVVRSWSRFDRAGGTPITESEALRRWRAHVESALLFERAVGRDVVHRARNEDMRDEPERTLREILDFLGEPWSARCLLPLERGGVNSSRVASVETLSDEIQASEAYRDALDFLGRTDATPVPERGDPAAMAEARRRMVQMMQPTLRAAEQAPSGIAAPSGSGGAGGPRPAGPAPRGDADTARRDPVPSPDASGPKPGVRRTLARLAAAVAAGRDAYRGGRAVS